MRRRILITLLAIGAVGGIGMGLCRFTHGHCWHGCPYSEGREHRDGYGYWGSQPPASPPPPTPPVPARPAAP
jgi:hypothetical protein